MLMSLSSSLLTSLSATSGHTVASHQPTRSGGQLQLRTTTITATTTYILLIIIITIIFIICIIVLIIINLVFLLSETVQVIFADVSQKSIVLVLLQSFVSFRWLLLSS